MFGIFKNSSDNMKTMATDATVGKAVPSTANTTIFPHSTTNISTHPSVVLKRGDIYYANLGATVGSEQGGIRPVVIIQNDVGNHYSPTTIVAAITSVSKKSMPTHVTIPNNIGNLDKDSIVMLEQIRTLDKCCLSKKIGTLPCAYVNRINQALAISLSL